jgi:hypothetical protein
MSNYSERTEYFVKLADREIAMRMDWPTSVCRGPERPYVRAASAECGGSTFSRSVINDSVVLN